MLRLRGADDADAERAAEAERIADGEHDVADARGVAVAHVRRYGSGVARVHAQHGDVGGGIAADDGGFVALAVLQDDFDRVGGFDDVVVGDDDAIGGNDEAGAERGDLRAALAQAFVEALHRRARRKARQIVDAFDALAGGDVHHGGRKPLVQIGEALRRQARLRQRRGGESKDGKGGQKARMS